VPGKALHRGNYLQDEGGQILVQIILINNVIQQLPVVFNLNSFKMFSIIIRINRSLYTVKCFYLIVFFLALVMIDDVAHFTSRGEERESWQCLPMALPS